MRQDKSCLLALAQREQRSRSPIRLLLQSYVCRQPETHLPRREDRPGLPDRDRVFPTGVVESWPALDAEVHLSPDDPDVACEPVALARTRHGRHEIQGLSQSLRREKTGQEHVRIRQVELLAAGVLDRAQGKVPALLVVENGTEDARRVEGGQAHPVYSAIRTDERRRMEVPDDPVVFDGQITHSSLQLSA